MGAVGAALAAGAAWCVAACPAAAQGAFPPLADPVHLPVLAFDGTRDRCAATVQVQNLTAEPTKAVLLLWRAATACGAVGEACAAPAGLACSGLLGPGAAWTFGPAGVPAWARSGVVYSLNLRRLSAVGSVITPDQPVADYLCGVLAAAVVDRCDNYALFRTAYDSGSSFGGVRLGLAYGGRLAVNVRRRCPIAPALPVTTEAAYEGVAGPALGGFDRLFSWSSYLAPTFDYVPGESRSAVLYVQNGGSSCASVEVWLQEEGVCNRTRLATAFYLAPGAVHAVPSAGHVREGTRGSAWVRASAPVVAAVDVVVGGARASYVAVPADLQLAAAEPPVFTAGSPVVQGPLPSEPDDPNNSAGLSVHIQNLSTTSAGEVAVTFVDPRGVVVRQPEVARLCPRGTRTFAAPDWRETRAPPASVRVESRPWRAPNGQTQPATNVSVVAEWRPGSGGGLAAWNLAPEPASDAWRYGRGGAGARLVALPCPAASVGEPGELVVVNTVPQPGSTSVVVLWYDANGLVANRCLSLAAQAAAVVPLAPTGGLDGAFRGAVVVSAAAWRHPVFDTRGRVSGNLAGLAAFLARRPAPAGESEAVSATAGLPFGIDGPGHPFAHVAPPCPTPPAVTDPGVGRRAFLPWTVSVAQPSVR